MVNEFDTFFGNIGSDLAKKHKSGGSFTNYLSVQNETTFHFNEVTKHDIWAIISTIKPKQSRGTDGISNHLLKAIINEVCEPLTIIINKSLKEGIVPAEMKVAKVVPLFKKGKKTDISNYRPISLLNVISKVLERVVDNQVRTFLEENKLIYGHKYGFRKGRNTIQTVLNFVKEIEESKFKKEYSAAVFCDLKKAFDTVNHQILLKKLEHYGVKGTENKWFQDYLSNRYQIVEIDNIQSELLKISCGVPQGSVLSPLLFLLFINDLPENLGLRVFLFADDTTLLATEKSEKKLMTKLNKELEGVCAWFSANKLTFHPDKTNFIKFYGTSGPNFELKIGNKKLEKIGESEPNSCVNFLGVKIDEKLSWKYHKETTFKKLSKNIMVLNKVKNELPKKTKLLIYNTLIKPHAEYGALIWHDDIKTGNTLDKLQKRAVRAITNAPYNEHTNPILKELQITKFSDIKTLQAVTLVKLKELGKLPEELSQNFKLANRENRSKSNFSLQIANSKIINNIVKSWNNISKTVILQPSTKSAVKEVKGRLLARMESKCQKKKCYVCKSAKERLIANSKQ